MIPWAKLYSTECDALEHNDDQSSNQEMAIGDTIPLASYVGQSEQEASEDESEISTDCSQEMVGLRRMLEERRHGKKKLLIG